MLQAIPEIEPYRFEGSPIFAEIGPIVLDQSIWAKAKKTIETGGDFACRLVESSLPAVPKKAELTLHIFPKSKRFSLRGAKDSADLLVMDLSQEALGFEIERKGKPNEFSVTRDGILVLKLAMNDISNRDPAVMALRTMIVMSSMDLSEAIEKKDYVRLGVEVQQLKSLNSRLLEEKETDALRIKELLGKVELLSASEARLKAKVEELEARDKRNGEVATKAQELVDSLSREKQFFFNVLLFFQGFSD